MNLDETSRFVRAGLLVVNEKFEIQYQNKRATAMIEAGSVLTVRSGLLYIDRSSVQRSLEALLQRALLADSAAERSSEILGIPDRSGVVRFALRVTRYALQE